MAKIRVHELAKELGIASKEMVEVLVELGLDVKNHMSTIEDSQASWVKKRLSKSDEDSKKQPAQPVTRDEAVKKHSGEPATQTTQKKPDNPRHVSGPRPQEGSKPSGSTGRREFSENREQSRKGEERHSANPRPGTQMKSPRNNAPRPTTRPENRSAGATGRTDNRAPGAAGRTDNRAPGAVGRTDNRGAGSASRPDNRVTRPAAGRPDNKGSRPSDAKRPPQRTVPGNTPRPVSSPERTTEKKPGEASRTLPGGAKTAGDKKAFRKNTPAFGQYQSKDYSRPGRKSKHKRKKENIEFQTPENIKIEGSIMVRDLAEKLNKNPAEIMKKLMELGIMATINQNIDFETAEIVSSLYDVKVERELSEEEKILEELVDIDDDAELIARPPVVTIMGHVDHGKTSLLDRIRQANVVSGEAGGITQHIGAYQVTIKNNKITFIDTPGHEAFTAMRARGANLTDIVILVVAADDGVMPQTVEAINHIRAAKVPFLVAINKIDKPQADPERIKQQLTEYNIVPEEWGGDTIFVPVSAKSGEGIENLLEMILLVAEMNEIRANPDRAAYGLVVEGELDKGRGAVATVLVLNGTLNIGDYIICGTNWCRVRAMIDDRGKRVDKALPSMPVEIMGWSGVPEAGGKVQVCDEKVAKEIIGLRLSEKKIEEQKQSSRVSLDEFFQQMKDAEVKELTLIIKGDVQGSVEALRQSLLRLATNEVKVNVIHSAVGAITETDVMLASASNAIIIGFNVRPDSKARKYAEDEKIDVRMYRVIYEAIDDVKKAMSGLLDPEYKEKFLGRAEVRALFKVPHVGVIAGSYVIDGKIQRNASVRVLRDGVIVYEGQLSSLKRFKDDAKEVVENYECGIGIKDFNDVKEGDIIEAYTLEEIPREL
ncbi:translation initiation factor IF-2 [Syntrophomonas wolfei]|uniref:Translation initiation factor IF-2 n=1 Tax=Syntrophomonas wolfei subsp. wolfei (strain DSM 2245B / Goettingen) TaxID=335541 RepID=IF2_SYNWW|nr:translation initiation factor IF-2 [Syntrophomonas wolfei]Q0AYI8.1 RecName: Full=Translation initiation factor IF-2 [Syntrophomonas wolfei subsp. wolfei str. Goettingen G311]ABI68216.1 bacterial translation initiation factor 2 (bIF-2) [Syntrophomonas wolfei subsp. wolfei str. Goettingen G311]